MDIILLIVVLSFAFIPACHAAAYCINPNTLIIRYCSGVADYCCSGSCCTTFSTAIIIGIVGGVIFAIVVLAVMIYAIVKTCCKTQTGRVIHPQPQPSVFVTTGQSGYPQYPMPNTGTVFVNPGPVPTPNAAYPLPNGNPAYPQLNPPQYYPPPKDQAPSPAVPSYAYQTPGTTQLPGQAPPAAVATAPGQAPPAAVATAPGQAPPAAVPADPGQAPPPASVPPPSAGNAS